MVINTKVISIQSTWLRWITALVVSISIIYITAKYGQFILTDKSVLKLLSLALLPLAVIEYQILYFRSLVSNILLSTSQLIAV